MKIRVALGAVIAVAAVAAGAPGSTQSAAPSVAANYDIYSIGIGGGSPTRVTTDPADDRSPSMSADGKTIAFSRGRSLWLMSPDGSNQRLLLAAPPEVSYEQPSWSATGRYIAFTAWDYSGCENQFHCAVPSVDVVRADGSGFREVQLQAMMPRWSPRGERLVLAGDVVTYDIQPTSIYVVTLSGITRRLAHSRTFVESPSWSPDGKRLLYTRYGVNYVSIYIVDATGVKRRRLRRGDLAEWSPNGAQIAVRDHGGLYVVRTRGPLHAKRLGTSNAVHAFTWNGRGKRLALVDWRLAVVRADGRGFRVLCCDEVNGFAPVNPPLWSRSGTRLFFAFKPGT